MPRLLIIIGLVLIVLGLLWPFVQKLGLGHLPGDIIIKRENFTFYFPITTCIIVSIVIAIVLWLFKK